MAIVAQLKRYDAPRINWGKWFLIGIGMLVSAFILIVPMVYIFVQAFSKGLMPVLHNLADPDMLHAIWLTVMIALITVPVNLVFGTLLAWLVTRFNFPGRQLLLTLLDIPFAVSPVVAGLVYLLFYGSNGPLGGWLDEHNLQIMFAWPGMVLATIFVTCPFVVRELVPVMMSQGSNEDEAAILLGASGWQMFRRVTLPNIRWALLYGVVLTNARAIGEFGAVSVVSGSIRGETLSLPLQIELLELRPDEAEEVLRAQNSRALFKEMDIPPFTLKYLPQGTVTLDNRLAGRYAGEVEITLTDLPADPSVNVMGRVSEEERFLLGLMRGGARFRFRLVTKAAPIKSKK